MSTNMRRIGLWILFALAALGGVPASFTCGAEGSPAVTNAAEADADFAVQGEYLGRLSPQAGPSEMFGLQVVAAGEGRFDGILFAGGLPGNGWDGRRRHALKGVRKNQSTQLESIEYVIEVAHNRANVSDRASNLGTLHRVTRQSATQGAYPPPGAKVLFGGGVTDGIRGAKPAPDGWLGVGGITTQPVGDFRLHLEFVTPYMPAARGQARGNSGVYIQQRYEVQILDSFGLASADNDCGSVYRQRAPEINMCFPPLSWQTYDITFRAPRWDSTGKKIANARLTVYHNGRPIHYQRELVDKTGAGQPEGPGPRPILLQDHGNPVYFRNIWIEDLTEPSGESALDCERPTRRLFRHR